MKPIITDYRKNKPEPVTIVFGRKTVRGRPHGSWHIFKANGNCMNVAACGKEFNFTQIELTESLPTRGNVCLLCQNKMEGMHETKT